MGLGTLGYSYDANGNITSITKDGVVQESYTYDALNQLKTVTRGGVTTTYEYDAGGNILSKTTGNTAVTYGYTDANWKDKLTSYNGQSITYDAIGNPLSYRDGLAFTWKNGRQLAALSKTGTSASYKYDDSGVRTSKTVNGVTTTYYFAGSQALGQSSSDGSSVKYLMDVNGGIYGIYYMHRETDATRGDTYYFAYNAQGDVIGLYNYGGALMASYSYDEWGNCTATALIPDSQNHAVTDPKHVAFANPFRYRGYYFDAESGLYYLGSRYYDPLVGRWINSDGVSLLSYGLENLCQYNMFAYCFNNPNMYYDPTGEFPILIGIIGLAVATYAAIAARDGLNNKESNTTAQQSFSGGYINDQSKVDQFRMGRAGAAWNGCGWIAAYNAMIMLSNPQQPAEVISYFDNAWGNIALGAFGTNPQAMANYFKSQGFSQQYNIVPGFMPPDTERVAQNASACILLYAHSQGAHYAALKWNGKSYDVYNDWGGPYSSITNYMSNVGGTFIRIWCID